VSISVSSRDAGSELPVEERPLHRRFAQGSPDAIAEVVSIVRSIVQHRGWFIPVDERADISQEALLDVVRRSTSSVFPTDEDFGNFVRVIAHRRCIDWVRARRTQYLVGSGTSGSPGPDVKLLTRERQQLACAVVSRLKPECRQIFGYHAGRGMTYAEIALALGRTEGAVRMQAFECVQRARQLLDRMVGAVTR